MAQLVFVKVVSLEMSLEKGTTLGVYEIVAPIGAGGMGEVYRARDRIARPVCGYQGAPRRGLPRQNGGILEDGDGDPEHQERSRLALFQTQGASAQEPSFTFPRSATDPRRGHETPRVCFHSGATWARKRALKDIDPAEHVDEERRSLD